MNRPAACVSSGLSEVYPFNDWNEDRRAAVACLIETA
jgi:hypothetical protein